MTSHDQPLINQRSKDPLSREGVKVLMQELTASPAYPLLKAMAEAFSQAQQGPLPLTPQDSQRFLNGAVLRRGFELFFLQVEKLGQRPASRGFMQDFLAATLTQPREATTETEAI